MAVFDEDILTLKAWPFRQRSFLSLNIQMSLISGGLNSPSLEFDGLTCVNHHVHNFIFFGSLPKLDHNFS